MSSLSGRDTKHFSVEVSPMATKSWQKDDLLSSRGDSSA